ncbi:cytochrome P450 [Thiohalocapsa sp.]|uniref:cytochrome P450 n=1 Tax=Thiohalocapsa sp. TaxID=2497641 RepID=UPI0025D4ACB6|nr:cytochrome P450 [Thiohalocapsa sp.]
MLPLHRSLPPLLRRDLLRLFANGAAAGPVVRLDAAGFRLLQVNAEPLMRDILLDKDRCYRKGSLMRRLAAVTGEGLLINDGERWKRHRRLANPALTAGSLPRYVPAMRRAIAQTIERWRHEGTGAGPRDLVTELSRTTLVSLLDSIFGLRLKGDRLDGRLARVSGVIHALLDDLVRRGSSLLAPPLAWPTPANRRFRRRIAEANAILDQIIAARRRDLADSDEPADLLGQWLLQRRRDSSHFSAEEMRDELMTMLIAGHHSLAIALAWALYHVAREPGLQAALQSETEAGRDLPHRLEDLDQLPLTRGVLLEALRLYPQPPILLREAIADHALGGYRIRRGDQLLLSIPTLHRDPLHWPAPECFEPRRFDGFNADAMMQSHHLGFGGGPRSCIGRRFAMLEGVLVIAQLIQAFRLRPATPDTAPVPPRFAGMLVPAAPLLVHAEPR